MKIIKCSPLLDQTSVYGSPNKNRNIAMRTYRVSIILAWSLSYNRTRKYNVRKSIKLILNSNVRSMYEKAIISEFGLYFTYSFDWLNYIDKHMGFATPEHAENLCYINIKSILKMPYLDLLKFWKY